jgi:hypothetical protein
VDIEKKLIEYELRGYSMIRAGKSRIAIWFESEKYSPNSNDDWALWDATVVNGGNPEHIEESIRKLENYLEIQRY